MATIIRDAVVSLVHTGGTELFSPACMVLIDEHAAAWCGLNYGDPYGSSRPAEHRIRGRWQSTQAGVWTVSDIKTPGVISAVITEGYGDYDLAFLEWEENIAERQSTRQLDELFIKPALEDLLKPD